MRLLYSCCLIFIGLKLAAWGFFSHKQINFIAIFTLPEEMFGFYKSQAHILKEEAIKPDQRRYAVEGEAPKHYIDLEHFYKNDSLTLDMNWAKMVDYYGKDSLMTFGILPWNLLWTKRNLTEAFYTRNPEKILRYSADIGHYIADAHVPLHTTKNYDGQLTGQTGIHAFWESQLPELFFDSYNLFTGKATYIQDLKKLVKQMIQESHLALDSVLTFEKNLSQSLDEDKKYTYSSKNNNLKKVYSLQFCQKFHHRINNQIERRMALAIKRIGDIWFTCWVDAGQPDLSKLKKIKASYFKISLIDHPKDTFKLKRKHE